MTGIPQDNRLMGEQMKRVNQRTFLPCDKCNLVQCKTMYDWVHRDTIDFTVGAEELGLPRSNCQWNIVQNSE